MSLWQTLGDHSASIITIATLGFLGSAGYLAYRLWMKPAPTADDDQPTRSGPHAADRAPSVELGEQEYQQRGQAKTVKVSTIPAPAPAARPAPIAPKPEPVDAMRQAERLEELGFHQPAQQAPSERAALAAAETVTTSGGRTQTAELDDILSRIDKVLAENPVMATATTGSPAPAAPEGGEPATKPVAKADSEEQQKLF